MATDISLRFNVDDFYRSALYLLLRIATRCGKASFIENVMAQLQQHEATAAGASPGNATAAWSVRTIDAPEQKFDFRGQDVPQPSVIQVWTRVSKGGIRDTTTSRDIRQ